MSLTFLDLFAGIGGFRLGLEQAGHRCLGFVEWDKFARKSYEAIHNTEGEWSAHDITKVSDDDLRLFRGRVDVIAGGFPCQAFSVAGNRKGFEDTRGTLFFEIARFASIIKPRYLFLENVKGLLNHDGGNTFGTILRALDELGYDAEWQVLNSKDFGVPQNRERVFIVCHLRGASTGEVFPITGESSATSAQVIGMLNMKGDESIRRVYSAEEGCIAPTLTTMQGGHRQPKIVQAVLTPDRVEKRQQGRRFKEPGEPAFTLNTQDRYGVMISKPTNKLKYIGAIGENKWLDDGKNLSRNQRQGNRVYDAEGIASTLSAQGVGSHGGHTGLYKVGDYRIRKLTPRECFRLQGFPDWAFDKAAEVNSDSQLYKQSGNSVTVNVVYEIAKRLK